MLLRVFFFIDKQTSMHACYLMRWPVIYLILFYLPALIHGYTLALKFTSDRFIYVYIIIYIASILYISADQCFTCICFCLYTYTPIWYISGSGDSLLTCADIFLHQYYIYLISARFFKTEKFWLMSLQKRLQSKIVSLNEFRWDYYMYLVCFRWLTLQRFTCTDIFIHLYCIYQVTSVSQNMDCLACMSTQLVKLWARTRTGL